MFLQGQFLSLVSAAVTCKLDADCTATPATPTCNVDAEVCTKTGDAGNAACKTVATGMSVTLGGECVADCKNVKTPGGPAVNVGGFHDAAGVCTEDTAASTTDNNACMPVKAKFSVNADK